MNAALGGDLAAVLLVTGLTAGMTLVVAVLWWWPLVLASLVVGVLAGHLGADLGVETGYFRLSVLDLIAVVAGGAAIIRLLSAGKADRVQLLWIVVTLVLAGAFLYGAASYGPVTSGIFYRRFLYLTTGTLYAMTFPWPEADLDRFAQLWLGAAALLAAAALTMWVFPEVAAIGPMSNDRIRFAYEAQRVLPASSALLLSQAAILGIAAWSGGTGSPMLRALAVVCLFVAILLFHRSVWVAIAAGLLVLTRVSRQSLVPVVTITGVAAFAGLAVVTLVGGLGHDLLAFPAASAVGEVLSESSTLQWRVTGWDILVSRTFSGGLFSTLFGGGFGVGYERLIGWSHIDLSPHNVYVEIFINAGLLGAGLWTLFHCIVLLRLWTGRADDHGTIIERRAAAAILVSLMVYGLPYTPSPEQGIMLGVLAVMAARSSRHTGSAQA